MLALNSYKNKLSLDGINDEDAENLLFFTTDSLFARKAFERVPNLTGVHNVIVGPKAGSKLKISSHNVMLGSGAGFNTTNLDNTIKKFSSYNTFVGNNAGYANVQGYYNTYIGYDSSKNAQNQISIDGGGNISHNIGIGVSNKSTGGRSILVGNDSYNIGRQGTIMGQQSSNSGRNSLIIGNKIENSGSNAFILRANGSQTGPVNDGMSNVLDNYFNLNDIFEGVIGSNINVTSTMTFNEPVNFTTDLNTENFQVNNQFVSLNETHINKGFVTRLEVQSKTILRDNVQILNTSPDITSVFDVEVETFLRGPVIVNNDATFNRNVNIKLGRGDEFIIRDSTLGDEIIMNVSFDNIIVEKPTEFKKEVVFQSNVTFADTTNFNNLASFSNTFTENAQVDYMYIRNPSNGSYCNIYEFMSDKNNTAFDIQVQNLVPWLDFNQSNIGLHLFNNEEFAPWIHKSQRNISLAGFNNDLAPWLDFQQSNIDLSFFNYESILPRWVKDNASKDNITQVVQTRFGWLNEKQNTISLNAFNNPWRWLRIEQKDILLDKFNFEDKYKWLKLPNIVGNGQSNYNLAYFHNDLAPWLEVNPADINVFNFNTDWINSNQRNVNLGDFYNDIAPWLNGKILQDMVPLSGFLQDELDLKGDLTIESNLTINGDVEFKGQNFLIHSSNVNYLNDVSIHGSLNIMRNLDVYGPDIVFENNESFRIQDGQDVSFSIDNQDLIINRNLTVNDNSTNPVLRIIDDQLWYKNENFDDLMKGLLVNIIETESNIQVNKLILFNEPAEFKDHVHFNLPVTTMSNVNMNDKLFLFPLDKELNSNVSFWTIFSEERMLNPYEADLLFVSKNGSKITFHDQFDEGVLNFTGQHRCSTTFDFFTDHNMDSCIGKIVVSTGQYMDIYNETQIRMNEAIPVVSLCIEEADQRVFGVVSGFENSNSDSREFKLGHLSFVLEKNSKDQNKVMVNSVGEGGIWVCDVNGAFKNGDYITTSRVDGYGMRQKSKQQFNYTVAKITCDCNFDIQSELYVCEVFEFKGISYKKAFVGCIYCC
jgi:hypothetical protein